MSVDTTTNGVVMASLSVSQYRNPLSKIALTLDELREVRAVRRVNLRFGCICRPDLIMGPVEEIDGVLSVKMRSRAFGPTLHVPLDVLGVVPSLGYAPQQFLITASMNMEQSRILYAEHPDLVAERSDCICKTRRNA